MTLGVTLPSRVGPLRGVAEYARRAEAAGFASAWAYEIYRSPMVMLAGAAMTTERITLGTGIASAFSRSPFWAASAAADLDDLSGGRMILGLGTGAPEALRAFHNTEAREPVTRMREYIDVVRSSWEYLATGKAPRFEGRHYTFKPPRLNPWGERELARPEVPIWLAAMGPHMLQLCGAQASGWLGYFATPELLEEYVRPNLEKGAKRTDRDAGDIEIFVELVCSISPDRELAMARARRQVGYYAIHPITDRIVERYGLLDAVHDLRARLAKEGLAAFDHTDDRLVDLLSITGTPDEAREKLAAYGDHVDHIALHTPYVPPFTAEDAADGFDNIITTFGR
jgi:alkanesulfonate monooxygenase SsuD/methylene tetrahydromethanopterin reductase-like flavin-dependent oxidoreductase (luciferase family)